MIRTFFVTLVILTIAFFLSSLTPEAERQTQVPDTLSGWNLFMGPLSRMEPALGVIPYDLNTPLFSDYAYKARFIRIPEGKKAQYRPDRVFVFPEGTVLIKHFYYPLDERKPAKGKRIIETRLLVLGPTGWDAYPYIWNAEQTEAYLDLAGGQQKVAWTRHNGRKSEFDYFIPHINQCKGCHSYNVSPAATTAAGQPVSGEIIPIGPAARHLNADFDYAEGRFNQLEYWEKKGILEGLPDMAEVPRLPRAHDPSDTHSPEEKARAYLDINCGHCHHPYGPANTSGMFLHYDEADPARWGVHKSPVSAGKGSGGRLFGIVPGKPEESILLYRMETTDPGEQMPEIGRQFVHDEGVKLIRDWIASMK